MYNTNYLWSIEQKPYLSFFLPRPSARSDTTVPANAPAAVTNCSKIACKITNKIVYNSSVKFKLLN